MENKPFFEDEDFEITEDYSQRNTMFDWSEALVISILSVAFIFLFIIRIVGVSGTSMLPTLENGDTLVISNLFYEPDNGDVIVFTKTSYTTEPYVKRIIATEGQTVDINFDTSEVFVDGVLLEEDYINELTRVEGDLSYPQTVPENHIFVMGDNRNYSSDSRASQIGMVDEELILGRVIFRFLPFDKIGTVN